MIYLSVHVILVVEFTPRRFFPSLTTNDTRNDAVYQNFDVYADFRPPFFFLKFR